MTGQVRGEGRNAHVVVNDPLAAGMRPYVSLNNDGSLAAVIPTALTTHPRRPSDWRAWAVAIAKSVEGVAHAQIIAERAGFVYVACVLYTDMAEQAGAWAICQEAATKLGAWERAERERATVVPDHVAPRNFIVVQGFAPDPSDPSLQDDLDLEGFDDQPEPAP